MACNVGVFDRRFRTHALQTVALHGFENGRFRAFENGRFASPLEAKRKLARICVVRAHGAGRVVPHAALVAETWG